MKLNIEAPVNFVEQREPMHRSSNVISNTSGVLTPEYKAELQEVPVPLGSRGTTYSRAALDMYRRTNYMEAIKGHYSTELSVNTLRNSVLLPRDFS